MLFFNTPFYWRVYFGWGPPPCILYSRRGKNRKKSQNYMGLKLGPGLPNQTPGGFWQRSGVGRGPGGGFSRGGGGRQRAAEALKRVFPAAWKEGGRLWFFPKRFGGPNWEGPGRSRGFGLDPKKGLGAWLCCVRWGWFLGAPFWLFPTWKGENLGGKGKTVSLNFFFCFWGKNMRAFFFFVFWFKNEK